MIKEHSGLPEAYPSSKDIYKNKETEILPNSLIEAAIDTSGYSCPAKKTTHTCKNFFFCDEILIIYFF